MSKTVFFSACANPKATREMIIQVCKLSESTVNDSIATLTKDSFLDVQPSTTPFIPVRLKMIKYFTTDKKFLTLKL